MLRGKTSNTISSDPPSTTLVSSRIRQGTEQQRAFWGALAQGDHHIMVEARAGCGKSSSCREGMWRMLERHSSQRIRYTVFNKSNADEFRGQCPPGVEVGTSHSFGFATLRQSNRCCQVEKNKTYLILDETMEGKYLPRWLRKNIAVLVGYAKNSALHPDDSDILDRLTDLVFHYDLQTYGRTDQLCDWTARVLKMSLEWTAAVDFDDMLWIPAIERIEFPLCDVLFIDEVQDFNPTQRLLVPLMKSASGRVVAVGDRYQAINMFRGAKANAMDDLSAAMSIGPYGLETFPLTVSFRCPQAHVALVQQFVPDLIAHASNPEGEIRYDCSFDQLVAEVAPGDLVICPTNAPVISVCLRLLAEQRSAKVRGRAIGDQLLAVIRSLNSPDTIAEAAKGVEQWRAKEMLRLSEREGVDDLIESVQDRANGLQAILQTCSSPSEVESVIAKIFDDSRGRSGLVTCSSVHRAKGDEAKNVWLIESPSKTTKRDWQIQQNNNLHYVALTRSLHKLVFVDPPQQAGSLF